MSDKTETSNQTDLQKEAEQLKKQANDHFNSTSLCATLT